MQFQSAIDIKPLVPPITYRDKILLIGSCFTEHIGGYLAEVKFNTLQNPNGILFNPLSICSSLISYIQNQHYQEEDLFRLNDVWHSWQHHSSFSRVSKTECLENINRSQETAHQFLKEADWLILTLGSSFAYRLLPDIPGGTDRTGAGMVVANCHKAPARLFEKNLCTIEEIITSLDTMLFQLSHLNPRLKILFTISPVRHLRDGVVENNRSKARLIEAVHHLVNKFDRLYYFPAYELVIDVLRDYRFFDIDLAHPNYQATQYVLEKFGESCFDRETKTLAEEIRKLGIAYKHKAFHPNSTQHQDFLRLQLEKTKTLQQNHPYLNFEKELNYFSGT